MVAVMRFTGGIRRLLGLGGGPSVPRPDETEVSSDESKDAVSQDALNGEEGLSEEEKARRRAERRRAKRKRQRERRKMEKVKSAGDTELDDNGGIQSELEESGSEVEEMNEGDRGIDVVEEEEEEEEEEPEAAPLPNDSPAPPPATGSNSSLQPSERGCEEDPEWDVSSAFVVNAVSHLRPKPKSKSVRKSRESGENVSRESEVSGTDAMTKRSASLTEKGIRLVQEGQYSQAVSMFTEAIRYDPKDYRFFGNRSYCYECMEQYGLALADAERAILLAPHWPKGYYRKGSALLGMKRYSEAEGAMLQVLELDKGCEEALNELYTCRVLQLMDLGYEEEQSVELLERYSTVQAVVAARGSNQDSTLSQQGGPCPSLWVGNVTTELSERHLRDLFKMYGEIESIRILHERFCAFVNFKNADMAARALEKLNGFGIENTRLVVRYPDRRTQRALPTPTVAPPTTVTPPAAAAGPRRRGPVNGDECYFWRTTGCHFGEKCHYKHNPAQRGTDRKPWQP